MARVSNITLLRQSGFHFISVRGTINFMEEFSDFSFRAFKQTAEHIENMNKLPSGEPLVCFHNTDLEQLDVEIGFPTAESLPAKNDIAVRYVPPRKCAVAIDLGPYEQQDPTLQDIFDWLQKNSFKPSGEIYYQYLNDAERPESELLTKMIVPVC